MIDDMFIYSDEIELNIIDPKEGIDPLKEKIKSIYRMMTK